MAKDRGPVVSTAAGLRPATRSGRCGLLLVGAISHLLDDACCSVGRSERYGDVSLFPGSSGGEALRLAGHPGVRSSVDVVFVNAQLADMTGVGLLDRVSSLLPDAIRVLLVDEATQLPAADDLNLHVADAIWLRPDFLDELIGHFARERSTLLRMHALQQRLEETHGALNRLKARYLGARQARDRLAASIRGVASTPGAGFSGSSLDAWWRDYGYYIELVESGCQLHRRSVFVDAVIDDVAVLVDGVADGVWQRAREPVAQRICVDPVLLGEIIARLFSGLQELLAPGAAASVRIDTPSRGHPQLEFRLADAGLDAVESIRDPFARLHGAPLAGLSLDLVIAAALCDVHGLALDFRNDGCGLAAALGFGAPPGAAIEGGALSVVRGPDSTL